LLTLKKAKKWPKWPNHFISSKQFLKRPNLADLAFKKAKCQPCSLEQLDTTNYVPDIAQFLLFSFSLSLSLIFSLFLITISLFFFYLFSFLAFSFVSTLHDAHLRSRYINVLNVQIVLLRFDFCNINKRRENY
jgi:hypothetical protein